VAFTPDGHALVTGGGFTRTKPGELNLWNLAKVLEGRTER
jgi:hypothetical protein